MNGWIILGVCSLFGLAGFVLGVMVTIQASWKVYGGRPHEVRPDLYPPEVDHE